MFPCAFQLQTSTRASKTYLWFHVVFPRFSHRGRSLIWIISLASYQKGCIIAGIRCACYSIYFFTGPTGSGIMLTKLADGTEMYYNTNDDTYAWSLSDDTQIDHSLLNTTEIQV